MTFKVELTHSGWTSLCRSVDYLSSDVGGVGNDQAAINFLNDFEDVVRRIKLGADSYAMVEIPAVSHLKLHKLHFSKMSYKVLYKVVGLTAYIVAIIHDRQSLKNIII